MPPKRDGGKPAKDLPTDSNNTDTIRKWTGRPLDEPMWYYGNKKLLFDEVEGARDFITKGVVISEKHGIVYVNNVNHAQAYINGTITEGTLEAPFKLASFPLRSRLCSRESLRRHQERPRYLSCRHSFPSHWRT